jgi:hypothetical protein
MATFTEFGRGDRRPLQEIRIRVRSSSVDQIRIKQIAESDIDGIIRSAQGTRFEGEDSADYQLHEAIIELKLIAEEGFEKETRQRKLAELFKAHQTGKPVVVLNPMLLDYWGRREYYNIVGGPMKTHIKKADKQLEKTAKRVNPKATRVLWIINTGYTALTRDEFKDVSIKCARNDTNNIDLIIAGGIYYHSDGFDQWIHTAFDEFILNVSRPFVSQNVLLQNWAEFLDEGMAEHLRYGPLERGKLPAVDLAFELDGVRFIKPVPPLPPSTFWPGGVAPRTNSREAESQGPYALTFPKLTEEDWNRFKETLPNPEVLQTSYEDWIRLQESEKVRLNQVRQPFLSIPITFEEFSAGIGKPQSQWCFEDIGRFVNGRLDQSMRAVLENVRKREDVTIVPIEYIYVTVREIGRDKGNDISSIYYVSELPGFEKEEIIIGDLQAFMEEAVCLAACHAVERGIKSIIYHTHK